MYKNVNDLPYYVFMGVEFILSDIVQDKDAIDKEMEYKIRKEIIDYFKDMVYHLELFLSAKEIVDFTEEFIDMIKTHNTVLK